MWVYLPLFLINISLETDFHCYIWVSVIRFTKTGGQHPFKPDGIQYQEENSSCGIIFSNI